MNESVTLTIDGKTVQAPAGQTLKEAAADNGICIPGLCALKGLVPVGACRLCIIEVTGVPRLLPACTTRVSEGMKVTTNSDRVLKNRKMIVELLFAERNHICSVCVANGHCELQTLASELGVDHTRFEYRYPEHQVDATHARFAYDANRCVLCTRCLRVCAEVEGARTWSIKGRGIHSTMITDLNEPWGTSETCTSCGKCVNACPTGALFEKGKAAGEMEKPANNIPYLSSMRTSGR